MTFDPKQCTAAAARLNPREREVLARLAVGKATKVIAAEMGVTPGTVECYCTRIYRTLNVHNRVEAARMAIAAGLA